MCKTFFYMRLDDFDSYNQNKFNVDCLWVLISQTLKKSGADFKSWYAHLKKKKKKLNVTERALNAGAEAHLFAKIETSFPTLQVVTSRD